MLIWFDRVNKIKQNKIKVYGLVELGMRHLLRFVSF